MSTWEVPYHEYLNEAPDLQTPLPIHSRGPVVARRWRSLSLLGSKCATSLYTHVVVGEMEMCLEPFL
jgi:hypothetical protein